MSRKPQPKRGKFSIGLWVRILVLFVLIGIVPYRIIYGTIQNNRLDREGKQMKAVVTKDRNYFGNSPVSQEYSLSYRFSHEGKVYIGDSQNSKYRIGDSILIEFIPSNPDFNRPVKNK